MVGISLMPELFTGRCEGIWKIILEKTGSVEGLMRELWREGARCVELRTVRPDSDPEEVRNTVQFLLNSGFNVSIHSKMKSARTAVSDVFDPISTVLSEKLLDSVNLTVHEFPETEETVSALLALSDRAMKESCNITFALENGRKYGDKSEGECSSHILRIVRKVDRPNVGICWDFGHMWYNVKKFYRV